MRRAWLIGGIVLVVLLVSGGLVLAGYGFPTPDDIEPDTADTGTPTLIDSGTSLGVSWELSASTVPEGVCVILSLTGEDARGEGGACGFDVIGETTGGLSGNSSLLGWSRDYTPVSDVTFIVGPVAKQVAEVVIVPADEYDGGVIRSQVFRSPPQFGVDFYLAVAAGDLAGTQLTARALSAGEVLGEVVIEPVSESPEGSGDGGS